MSPHLGMFFYYAQCLYKEDIFLNFLILIIYKTIVWTILRFYEYQTLPRVFKFVAMRHQQYNLLRSVACSRFIYHKFRYKSSSLFVNKFLFDIQFYLNAEIVKTRIHTRPVLLVKYKRIFFVIFLINYPSGSTYNTFYFKEI